jgi:hypothetical protein
MALSRYECEGGFLAGADEFFISRWFVAGCLFGCKVGTCDEICTSACVEPIVVADSMLIKHGFVNELNDS